MPDRLLEFTLKAEADGETAMRVGVVRIQLHCAARNDFDPQRRHSAVSCLSAATADDADHLSGEIVRERMVAHDVHVGRQHVKRRGEAGWIPHFPCRESCRV
jgi:hypothetical protein